MEELKTENTVMTALPTDVPEPWEEWLELTSTWSGETRQKFLVGLLEQAPELYIGQSGLVMDGDQTDKILDALLLGTSSGRRKQIQYVFRAGLSNGNASDLWTMALPSYRLSVEHDKTVLDPLVFATRSPANAIEAKLLAQLPDLVGQGPKALASVVLTGAVLWGDIRSPDHLEAFFRCDKFFYEGGLLVACLDMQGGNKWNWFIPESVQLLLHGFRDQYGLPMSLAVEQAQEQSPSVRGALQSLARLLSLPQSEAKALVEKPHWLSRGRCMSVLPSYLMAYISGIGFHSALADWEWARLLAGRKYRDGQTVCRTHKEAFLPVVGESLDIKKEPVEEKTQDIPVAHLNRCEPIYTILKELAAPGTSLTIQDSIKALQVLDGAHWWPIERVLLDWVVDQLGEIRRKKGAPSTVLRYFNAARAPLCAVIEDFDIRTADSQSLLEIFDAVLSCEDSLGARCFLTLRLKAFHRFCEDQFPDMARDVDFRDLDNAVFNHIAEVRTSFPLDQDIQTTVHKMHDGERYIALPLRIQCSMLAGILAFRLGLRKTETAHIRLMDFQDGEYPELVIRPSQWGRLKSRQAERRIPLLGFLDSVEIDMLRTLHAHRSGRGLPSEVFLTDHAEGKPLRGEMLFRPFLKMLREVSGQDNGAHALRHGFTNFCLARFHIAQGLELPKTIYAFQGPRFEKLACQKMVATLSGRSVGAQIDMQFLYGLAKLLGHLSPSTTIRSYVHILDLLVCLLRQRSRPRITVTNAASLMGLTYQRVQQLLDGGGIQTSSASIGDFLKIMQVRGGEFSPFKQNEIESGSNLRAVELEQSAILAKRKELIEIFSGHVSTQREINQPD